MPWKVDENGAFVALDGNPIWVGDDGSEVGVNHKDSIVTIATVKQENASFRRAAQEAEARLKSFEGIDPKDAAEAIQFKQSLDGKKVWDEESTKRMVEASVKPVQEKLDKTTADLEHSRSKLHQLMVGDKIKSSEFIKKTNYTPADAERLYSHHFKLDGENFIPHDDKGNPIYSSTKAGEYADVDEALSIIINARPDKDVILKGTGASGSGSAPSFSGGGTGQPKTSVQKIAAGLRARAAG